jgi:hypothetical protein
MSSSEESSSHLEAVGAAADGTDGAVSVDLPRSTSASRGSTPVSAPPRLAPAMSFPAEFEFGEVTPAPRTTGAPPPAPSLGPLAAFVGNWHGSGFNTIFRPDNSETPTATKLPHPVPQIDNVLELNLTSETLSFSPSLGSVPNRGEMQGDIFLDGVPYLQSIQDVTEKPVGIHLEPGLWMAVPPTKVPAEGPTLVRMASIPHGTTICAQGTWRTYAGAPNIPPVDITPFQAGNPSNRFLFPSQTAIDGLTQRIPQDLTPFISAGTITQAILDDPNTVLRNAISGLHIATTTEISITTSPTLPLFGGGTDNIAFLLGDPEALTNPNLRGQNAQTIQMSATFWIEEVQHTIIVPPFEPGQPPLKLSPETNIPGHPVPTFILRPPIPIPIPRPITITSTQIQYSQMVELNFNGLTWPHVSVATLIPVGPVPVSPPGWD